MAKSNHADNLAEAPKADEDPISELSDIMKFDPVDAAIEKADAELQLDLENELLGDLALVEPESHTDDAEPADRDISAQDVEPVIEATPADKHPIPVPGIDDVPDDPDMSTEPDLVAEPDLVVEDMPTEPDPVIEDVPADPELVAGDAHADSEAPEVAEEFGGEFDDVFSQSLDEPEMDASKLQSVPEELESQLNNLLAGLGVPDNEPDDAEDNVEPDLVDAGISAEASEPVAEDPIPAIPELNFDEQPLEEEALPEIDDPLESLADIASPDNASEPVNKSAAKSAANDPAPLIETADITDEAVPVDDDLNIPDVAFESEVPTPPDFEDLDEEFSKAFNKLSEFDKVEEKVEGGPGDDDVPPHLGETLDNIFDEMSRKTAEADAAASLHSLDHQIKSDGAGVRPAWEDDLDLDDKMGPSPGLPPIPEYNPAEAQAAEQGGGKRRGVMIAMIVAAIAIVGGIGAFAVSFGDGDGTQEPALVKADDSPIKVKPKDPGGKTVPNEDKKVYEQVAGTGENETPVQEKLISTAEEPIDVTVEANTPRVVLPDPATATEEVVTAVREAVDNNLPAEKSDDRVLPDAEPAVTPIADELIAVKPRRVRTLIVKPDGTLVPREEPAPAEETVAEVANELRTGSGTTDAAETAPADAGQASQDTSEGIAADNGQSTEVAAVDTTQNDNGEVTNGGNQAATEPAETETAASDDAAANEGVIVEGIPFPTPAPRAEFEARLAANAAAEARRREQQAAEEARREQERQAEAETQTEVAAATPQPAVNSEWWVQISSQPSREGAQASYANMASRYGSIIGDRGVNIVRADIEGKGTYYRVRIAGGSRNEAAQLCNRLKNAGGNCFIAR